MEITLFVLAILSFIIAYLTFKKDHLDKPKEKANFLSQKLSFAEKSTRELIEELQGYVSANDCIDEHFMQGLTYGESLTFLNNAYYKLFSEDISKDILEHPSVVNDDLINSVEAHIKHIQEVRTYFKFYVTKDFSG